MSYAALAGFFTQKHPFWHCSPPSSHYTLIPLFFSIFITLPLIPGLSTRFQKMPESSQHQSAVTLWLGQLDTLITGNFCSPGIESSQCLIRQVPSNLVPFESYRQGEYTGVDGIEGFGELGGVRWVECWFYSFSIFTYFVSLISPSFPHQSCSFFLSLGQEGLFLHHTIFTFYFGVLGELF